MYVVPQPLSAATFVNAAVNVVLPWSTCPIVPTFTCGLVRSNLPLDMISFPSCRYTDPVVPLVRIERTTSPLPRECSTTELQRRRPASIILLREKPGAGEGNR